MYAAEMTSDGMTSFMTIGSGIQIIFRALPQELERI
jgi:hypothetical protein